MKAFSRAFRNLVGSIGFMTAIIGMGGFGEGSVVEPLVFMAVGAGIMFLYYVGLKRRGEMIG